MVNAWDRSVVNVRRLVMLFILCPAPSSWLTYHSMETPAVSNGVDDGQSKLPNIEEEKAEGK